MEIESRKLRSKHQSSTPDIKLFLRVILIEKSIEPL